MLCATQSSNIYHPINSLGWAWCCLLARFTFVWCDSQSWKWLIYVQYPGHSHHRNAIRSVLIFLHPSQSSIIPISFHNNMSSHPLARGVALRPQPHFKLLLYFQACCPILSCPVQCALSRFRRSDDATTRISTAHRSDVVDDVDFVFVAAAAAAIPKYFYAGNQMRVRASATQNSPSNRFYWWTLQKIFQLIVLCCWYQREQAVIEWVPLQVQKRRRVEIWKTIFMFIADSIGAQCALLLSMWNVADDVNFTLPFFLYLNLCTQSDQKKLFVFQTWVLS